MTTSMPFIPFHRPCFGAEELTLLGEVLESGWVTTGPKTKQFEEEFRAWVGAPYALAVNSCTAGLHLALAALDIGPGDEVITTPMTFCATVNAILHVGATPVLADIGEDFNIDPESIESRITARTRAIIPVHMAGLPCDLERIWDLAERHGLKVVEDAAHAAGTRYRGTMIGGDSRSDAVAFSFYATKNLTSGEGGMITTHDGALLERMRRLCLHGISKDAWNRYAEKGNWFYQVVECGFKYNLSDLQAAVGLAQLRKQELFLAERRRLAGMYRSALADLEEVELPPGSDEAGHCWHLYILRLRTGRAAMGRNELIEELKARGIGASVHFIPIPMHPYFAEYAGRPENQCPRAMALFPRILSLPLYPGLTGGQVERVASAVRGLVGDARRGVGAAAGLREIQARTEVDESCRL